MLKGSFRNALARTQGRGATEVGVDWADRIGSDRLRSGTTDRAKEALHMVFDVEPLVWVPGVRGGDGVRNEDRVLVTTDQPEILSRVAYGERPLS